MDSSIAVLCLACCIIYSGVLGDVMATLLDVPEWWPSINSRSMNIVFATVTLLFPLSLSKNLSALTWTSILGFASILYTVLFITIRSLDGSYAVGTGKFVVDLNNNIHSNNSDHLQLDMLLSHEVPASATTSTALWWKLDASSLVLFSTYGLAYVAHYNAPTFYRELENTNSRRFAIMVSTSYALLTALYTITMVAGFSTFGTACHGNILLNYHSADALAILGRVATGCSILFGYPMIITGTREGLIRCSSSFGYPQLGHDKNHATLVGTILTVVTLVSCLVPEVSLVVGVTGATLGSAIVYLCPPLIYVRAVRLVAGPESPEYRTALWKSLPFLPLGVAIATLGVYRTIQESILSSVAAAVGRQ